MKNILSILGTITLIGTSTSSLVACNTEYTSEELAQLKEKNKINTTNKEIRDNLEWIAPQEKPFNQIDDKYYFVVWRGNKNDDWHIIKFQNNIEINKGKLIEDIGNYTLNLSWAVNSLDLTIYAPKSFRTWYWRLDNKERFKYVYRWNNNDEPNINIENELKIYLDL